MNQACGNIRGHPDKSLTRVPDLRCTGVDRMVPARDKSKSRKNTAVANLAARTRGIALARIMEIARKNNRLPMQPKAEDR